MEKQLLFLLDWELGITEQDLYRNLDPFLAPIRDEIERQEEHARIKAEEHARIRETKKRQIREQQRIEEEMARLQHQEYAAYEAEYASYSGQFVMDPSGTVVMRRTDSTPSSMDVPELTRSSRSGTNDSMSSASSYVSSLSRSGTPASSIGSYVDDIEHLSYESLSRQYSTSPQHIVRDVVHVHGAGPHKMLPYEIPQEAESKKKVKGNIFSRFLNGKQTTTTY